MKYKGEKFVKNWISILLAISLFIVPSTAKADVAGLTPCKDSKEFQRRLDQSVKKLQARIKKYDAGSPPALALEKQIEKTQTRFDRYGKAGLLCGTDGLPHLITDGRWNHSGEFVIPGLFFIYIAGWISAFKEFTSGNLIAPADEITVSPR